MYPLACPVCSLPLNRYDRRYRCENRHSYDIARNGYVNLLMSQKSGISGDDKGMVRARKSFLEKGYYRPLLERLQSMVRQYVPASPVILDAGCGECWYTAGMHSFLREAGYAATTVGVDISKSALALGAKRCKELLLAVAGVHQLPVLDASCHLILSVFAPYSLPEFARVLRPEGVFFRVYPLEEHLWSLKKAVYATPRPNPPETLELPSFTLAGQDQVRGFIQLSCREDILNLFAMTPYYYRTGKADRDKLSLCSSLETEIAFGIAVYTVPN